MSDQNERVTAGIKELRKRQFPSQQSLAVAVGTSVRSVAHWEAGRVPSFKFLTRLGDIADAHKHTDLSEVFRSAAAAEWGLGKQEFVVRPRNGTEMAACVALLEAMRDPKLKKHSKEAIDALAPVIKRVLPRLEKELGIHSVIVNQ